MTKHQGMQQKDFGVPSAMAKNFPGSNTRPFWFNELIEDEYICYEVWTHKEHRHNKCSQICISILRVMEIWNSATH